MNWLGATAARVACALLLSIVAARPAGATDCTSVPDGTLCDADSNPCTYDTCSSGTCVAGPNAPDGTPCDADGQFCTYDTCVSGVCTGGPARDCASTDNIAIDFENPPYTTGTINGQDGWSSLGAAGSGCAMYDHAVDSSFGTTGFAAQSLRISNAVVSGCFSDQTFSKSLPDEVGETDATNLGFSGGTRRQHFESQFSLASVVPGSEQPGLKFSTSADRGDGARMTYLRFEDTSCGINVFFDDYEDVAPFGSVGNEADGCGTGDDFVETQIGSCLSRTPHTFRVTLDTLEGPRNDVVKVYIDGSLAITGTSWEDYFRWCEGNDVSRTVDSVLFRTGGTPGTSECGCPGSCGNCAGAGFLIDNLTTQSGVGGDACNAGTCNESTDTCDLQPTNEGGTCPDDGNDCTTDVCASGTCTHPNKPNGQTCDADGLFCTYDTCSSGTCTPGGPRDCASTDMSSINFESPTYTTGTINGQDGWSSLGAAGSGCAMYDHAVDSSFGTTGFAAQSLRISNAVLSGCFSDQTFSKSLPDEVGETDATNNGFSGGTRRQHFEGQFDLATVTPGSEQPGLYFSTSADRGDGARMTYLRFEDSACGINVFFDDYQDFAPFGSPGNEADGCGNGGDDFIETQVGTCLTRTPHTFKVTLDALEGPRNDVVKVYIDGSLVHTGTSWEDFFRWCEGNDVSRTVDSLLFRTGGTQGTNNCGCPGSCGNCAGAGFLIDNVKLQSGVGGDACNAGACNESTDTCDLQPANNGGPCPDDGNGCTNDVCASGTCTHPNNSAPCSDGIFCNGADTCSGGSCSIHAGDPCTGGPVCNNSCNEGAGNCFNPNTTTCTSDGNVCTDDHCNGSGTCVHTANSAPCSDGIFCNGADTCSGTTCSIHAGNPCTGGPECNNSCNEGGANCFNPNTTACTADTNDCTDDHCSGSGSCVHTNSSSGTPCNDHNLCTQTDQCNGSGTCVGSNPVVCTALDQCHVPGVCAPMTGMCSNPNKPDGQVCDDGNVCTQGDACQGGVCVGNNTGADTDGDGYCDFQETQAGCNPNDPKEIPPQAVTFGGLPSEHSVGANGLITYFAPGSTQRATISTGTDVSCATTGVCGPNKFCTAGTISDPCMVNADCNQPLHNCRIVVNYGSVSDLAITRARLGKTDILTSFQPATPGCTRKVDLTLDPSLTKEKLRLRATGTLGGRVRRDNDRFLYGP